MRCYSVGSPAPGNNGEAAFIANCPTPVDWRAVRKGDGVTLTDVYVAGGSGKFGVKVTPVLTKQTGEITATLDSSVATKSFTVQPISVQSLTLTPNPVIGGNPVTGTATLECAAPYDITVALSSTQPTIAQPAVPSLLVPAGTRTKTFGVNTNTVTVSSSATIKATANGRAKSKKLVVNP